jgi:hypothetical protein
MLQRQEESWSRVDQFLALTNEELGEVDPVVMNLLVAKGIPSLADLNIGDYVRVVDEWAADLLARMPVLEVEFRQTPKKWRHDLDFFRLGVVCWYMEVILGICFREDQRNVKGISYTNPSDLFLNGVIDTRRGTCGNIAVLNVVLGRRIGLPVSLACVGSHYICRYDDGKKKFNIETTETGRRGFSSQTDEYVLNWQKIPAKAKACGSDLRPVTPREMLGLFLGLRARHLENTLRMAEAEPDYLLARYLFPGSRYLYIAQNQVSVQRSAFLFEPGEKGHPIELASWLRQVVSLAPWARKSQQSLPITSQESKEKKHVRHVDAVFQQIFVGPNFK